MTRPFLQDQDQDQDFFPQDQDFSGQDQDFKILSSRSLETKTLVSRTTSLDTARRDAKHEYYACA
jgi:hypothetical protein